jgi:hypothetical protein
LQFIEGVNYIDYIEAGENIIITVLGEEIYQFQAHAPWDESELYEPIIITPETDLSSIETGILFAFAPEMYYMGEGGDDIGLTAKRSETREHIWNSYYRRKL